MAQLPLAGARVFVTHSHQDNEFTARLAGDLTAAGATVWVDIQSIVSGDFVKRINEGLKQAEWVIYVITTASLQSSSVEMEINAALDMLRQNLLRGIIPIIAAPVHANDIPPLFRTLQRYDATVDYAAAVAGLIRALSAYSAVTSASPEAPQVAIFAPNADISPHRQVNTILPPRADFQQLQTAPDSLAEPSPESSAHPSGALSPAAPHPKPKPSLMQRIFGGNKDASD